MEEMNKENYSKAFKEVYIILKFVGKEIQHKVPTKILKFIEENMDKDYFFMLDDTISLEEQSFMDETLGIISLIWRDYLCTNEEREKIKQKDEEMQNQMEKERIKKYNPDDLFKNREEIDKCVQYNKLKQTHMIEYKEKNFIQKIFDRIKHLLKRERM